MANRKTSFHLRRADWERLDMIRDIHGVSKSGAVRAAIALLAKHLGLEKDDLKNDSAE